MKDIVLLVAPIYLLLSIGLIARRSDYLEEASVKGVAALIMRLLLPAVLFGALATNPLSDTLRGTMALVYALTGMAMLALAYLLARRSGMHRGFASVEAMGAACPNSAFIGLPVVTLVIGPDIALQTFALCVLVENILMFPASIALIDAANREQPAKVSTRVVDFLRNPLVIATVSGLLWALSGISLPTPATKALELLTRATAPIALITVGALIPIRDFGGYLPSALRVALFKLLLFPTAVLLLLFGFGDAVSVDLGSVAGTGDEEAIRHAALVLFAASPMVSVYAVVGERHGRGELAGAIQLVVICLSLLSIPFFIAWLGV